MAAAKYFLDRGLVAGVKPDATGAGVTITASSAAAGIYHAVSDLPHKPPNNSN